MATLYHQIQILQDEVRRLQGLVEEQEHRINRLVREQRERYLDLDQRILQLQGHAPGPDAPPTALATPPATNAASDAQGEDQAYNAAFNAMRAARELPPAERAGEYEQAIDLFQAVIDTYPNGKLAANALYWQGEIRLASDELELARQAFAQLPSAFGNHAKVPDALYKLGVVHHRLGEDAEALRILDRVIAEYPDHSGRPAGPRLRRRTALALRRRKTALPMSAGSLALRRTCRRWRGELPALPNSRLRAFHPAFRCPARPRCATIRCPLLID